MAKLDRTSVREKRRAYEPHLRENLDTNYLQSLSQIFRSY